MRNLKNLKIMKKFFVLLVAILGLSTSISASAQSYGRFYSDSYIIAKIEKQGYINSNHQVYPEHLYIRLKGNTAVTVTGYIKIRYIEEHSGKTHYKEKYFSMPIRTSGSHKVSDYYKPTSMNGYYETIGFYIDSVTPY